MEVMPSVLLALIVILIAAKIGAIIAVKFKQPEVLGELIAGIIIGNLTVFNYFGFEFIKENSNIEVLASLGVIILLFEVGLEATVGEMLKVGVKSLLVAIVGVITPFALAYYSADFILPGLNNIQKIFLGAILTATSVGITARVFKDLNFIKAPEAQIVLGAAVIDDILGLIILAIISALAQGGTMSLEAIFSISAKAIGFVVFAIVLGKMLAGRTVKLVSIFKVDGMMLTVALVLCFTGAYLADRAGLAAIVGAFAIGLVLEEVHFEVFNFKRSILSYIRPVAIFLVPIFFVLTGMHVDLAVFAEAGVINAALLISLIAIIGKLVCAWTFTTQTPLKRLIIGIGMVPRGEVGLIFASAGRALGVVDNEVYAITVIVVMITTLVAPIGLNILLQRK